MTIDQVRHDRPSGSSSGGRQRKYVANGNPEGAIANAGLPAPPRLAAPVKGFAAWALVLLVDRYGPSQLVGLRRLAERGRLDPAYLGELQSSWAAIREAAEEWLAWEKHAQTSVGGRVSANETEARPSSSKEIIAEIDTDTAAKLLEVSTSRIRQMARAGEIQGRKVGRVWLISLASVKAYRGAR